MKLEVHTFDPEFVNALMRKQPVPEGEVLELGSDARLVYVRTFSGRVKHFPQIVHFDVELLTDRGSGMISSWLFEHVGRRSIERILVDHQDIKLDVDRLRDALDRSR
jgi:hypothetical protein